MRRDFFLWRRSSLGCGAEVLQLLQVVKCGLQDCHCIKVQSERADLLSGGSHQTKTRALHQLQHLSNTAPTATWECMTRLPIGSCKLKLTFGETMLLLPVAFLMMIIVLLIKS